MIGTRSHSALLTRGEANDLRVTRGFSLAETLVALLIVVMVTAVASTGVSVAHDAYYRARDAANAQVALTTTTAALRNEYGLAIDVRIGADGNFYYQNAGGGWVSIAAGEESGLNKHYYSYSDADGFVPITSEGADLVEPLIPEKSLPDGLRVTYTTMTYADGLWIVEGLQVENANGDVLASIGDASNEVYLVRSVLCD